MKLNKKLLLSLGSVASAALPIATVVSCGSELVKDADGNVLMSYVQGDKTVYFNLNKDESEQVDTSTKQLKQFLPAIFIPNNGNGPAQEVTRDTFIEINDAFQKATDPRFSNIDILKNGDVMHVVFTTQIQKETSYAISGTQGFAKRPLIKINLTMEVDYIYNDHSSITYPLMKDANKDGRVDSTHPDQRDKERVKVRSNFLDNLIEGINQYGMLTNKKGIDWFFPQSGNLTDDGTLTSGTFVAETIASDNLMSLAANASGSINSAIAQIPRNYETTVKLPSVDLTGYFVKKPHASTTINFEQVGISGSAKNGFHFIVPNNSKASTKAKLVEAAKKLAPANTMNGFFKGTPTITTAWKGGTEYNNTAATETTIVVTASGTDWNGNALTKSYEVLVTPTV